MIIMPSFVIEIFRTTGEDRRRDGFDQRGHANRGKSAQGHGAMLRYLSKVLEKVSIGKTVAIDDPLSQSLSHTSIANINFT